MVRLVFRPYTQFRRSICTSESLRTSIRVSPDFVLTRHSSPSFGSQRVRSGCASSRDENETPRECGATARERLTHPPSARAKRAFTFIAPLGLATCVPMTRAHARLLGPCFKTGPESTQSYSVADGRVPGLFESSATNSRTAPRSALGPSQRGCAELATGRTPTKRRPTATEHRRASRPGHRVVPRGRGGRSRPPRGLTSGPWTGTRRVATSY